MSAHQTLLAEAVAHGLDEGWWAAKRRAVQPTKALLMECWTPARSTATELWCSR